MWEWEWNQAHGWGHYVAVDNNTARRYADMWNRKFEGKYKWKSLDELNSKKIEKEMWRWDISYDDMAWYWVLKKVQEDWYTVKEAIDYHIKNTKEFTEKIKEWIKQWWDEFLTAEEWKEELPKNEELYRAFNKLKEWDFDVGNGNRNLYEVDIPDPVKKNTPTGSNYWEEDGMLWKKEVYKLADALDKYAEKNRDNFEYKGRMMKWQEDANEMVYYDIKEEAKHLRTAEMWKWKVIFTDLENIFGEKWASKFLESLWYDWIHYYWWRDWEAYVIFNDDALQITKHHKY